MQAPPILSRESRWLRLGGMGLMVVAMSAGGFLDKADLRQLVRSGDTSSLSTIALVFVLAANLFVLGLVFLLAGLRQLSLRTDVLARRGALARLGAANLMLLCFAFVALQDSEAFDEDFYTSWFVIPLLVLFIVVARVSILWFRSGWKYEARTAQQALASDPRPPVAYLRSFGIDNQFLVTQGGRGRLAGLLNYTASVSPEQEMAFIMEQVGPVVAIGKPGERLPELGAARLYVRDDEWQEVVRKFMREAALIVIRGGETAGLWWEITEALAQCPPQRVIIVALGPPATLETFERRFADAFGEPAAPPPVLDSSVLTRLLRMLFPYGQSTGKIIYFDEHAKPHEEPLAYRATLPGLVLSPYRPYRDSLQAAFKSVFAKLGLPWTAKRSQAAAVLLALFGGVFGLHHFYTGHTRRGLWHLGFFWLFIPTIILGWIDAVRLALLDDNGFQAQLKIDQAAQDER